MSGKNGHQDSKSSLEWDKPTKSQNSSLQIDIPAMVHKVYFEVTNYCNFRCEFCPIVVSCRKRQHMDFNLLTRGIDEVVSEEIAATVGFHVLGEPLLHPKIFDAITYANKKGLRTEVTTNGSLLTEIRVQKLIEARVDKLTISLQILGESDHVCRRSSLSYSHYYQRIMEAIRLIHEADDRLEVKVLLMNTISKRLFDVERPMQITWDRVCFKRRLATLFQDIYAATNGRASPYEARSAASKLNLFQLKLVHIRDNVWVSVLPFVDWGNAFTSKRVFPARFGDCVYAFSSVGILSNGEVTICCADFDGKTALGNLHDQSLTSILTSDQARVIAKGFKQMKIVHPHCQRCLGATNPFASILRSLVSICLTRIFKFCPAGELNAVPLIST